MTIKGSHVTSLGSQSQDPALGPSFQPSVCFPHASAATIPLAWLQPWVPSWTEGTALTTGQVWSHVPKRMVVAPRVWC